MFFPDYKNFLFCFIYKWKKHVCTLKKKKSQIEITQYSGNCNSLPYYLLTLEGLNRIWRIEEHLIRMKQDADKDAVQVLHSYCPTGQTDSYICIKITSPHTYINLMHQLSSDVLTSWSSYGVFTRSSVLDLKIRKSKKLSNLMAHLFLPSDMYYKTRFNCVTHSEIQMNFIANVNHLLPG